jgi:hypothetical protein
VAGEVALVNGIIQHRVSNFTGSHKDSHIALLDVHSLMTYIYQHPTEFLNGSLPLNVTGSTTGCHGTGGDCWTVREDSRDSFFWYDELHPSEQVSRVIASKAELAVQGKGGMYVSYW